MGQYVSDACSRLQSHWASWITADDFRQIRAAGLNHVRIPIGYWAFDNQHGPYCKSNQFDYLTKAVGWARDNGLKVMIVSTQALAIVGRMSKLMLFALQNSRIFTVHHTLKTVLTTLVSVRQIHNGSATKTMPPGQRMPSQQLRSDSPLHSMPTR